MRYIRPVKDVSGRYPNKYKRDAISGMAITHRGVKKVSRRDQMCIIMRHEDFRDREVYCVEIWFWVDTEGPDALFFDGVTVSVVIPLEEVETEKRTPLHASTREDINSLLEEG